MILAFILAGTQFVNGSRVYSAVSGLTVAKTDSLAVDVNNNSQADPGDSIGYIVTITNPGIVDVTAAAFNDIIDVNTTLVAGSVKTTPIARNDSGYSTVGNVQLMVSVGQSVLLNDNDPDGSGAVSIFSYDSTSVNGGSVVLAADGSFTYYPAAGYSGTDTFTYTVHDVDDNADFATVSIAVGPVVWFINNAVGGPGDGRFTSPFSSVANFNSLAADDPGDYIFVYQGSGAYAGSFTLLNNQLLIGHGVSLTISPNLSIAAGSRPTISNVALGSGNTMRGLNINTSSGTAISGASVGTLIINNISVTNSGGAGVSLGSGAVTATFDSISSNGGVNGVTLTAVTGSFVMNGGTIQNATNNGVDISSSSGTLTGFSLQNSTISNNFSTGLRANIQGTGVIGKIDIGANTFSGNNIGVDLATNDTANVKYDVHNNTMNGTRTQVNIAANDPVHNNVVGPTMEGHIRNNAITTSPTGSTYIAMWVVADGDGTITTNIASNNIANFGDSGIDVESRGGTGHVYATIANNTATTTATFPLAGMFLRSGNGTVGETSLLCVNLSSNQMTGGPNAVGDYYLDRFSAAATIFQIQSLPGAPTSNTGAVGTYVVSTDLALPATTFVENGTYTQATCNAVSFASLPNSHQVAQGSKMGTTAIAVPDVKGALVALKESSAPWAKNLLAALSVSNVQASGETVSTTLGLLNPGQVVTVTFLATINDPLVPSAIAQVCNQGTVTADGGLSVLTDDPDVGGAADPTCTVLADNVPPDTTIDSSPSNPSNSSTGLFTFSGTDNLTPANSLTFECDIDSGGFSACTSPFTTAALLDGSHTFQVRAKDAALNVDQTPASYTWVIDATAPNVSIDQASGQADPTASSPINFTAVFTEAVTGFGSSASDVSLSGTAGATTSVVTEIAPNDGTTYNVAVSGMSANGTVIASIPADAAADAAGNGNTISSSIDNTVTFSQITTPVITWANPADIVYGTALSASQLSATASVPGSFIYTPGAGTVLLAGDGQILHVDFTPTDNFHYTTAAADVIINVTPAPLTITADDKTKTFGSPNPVLTASYSGFVMGNTPASLDTPVVLTTTATPSSPVGAYPITASGASDSNYTITFAPGTLTITQAVTSLLYNGDQIVNVGSKLKPAGLLSSAVSACVVGQTLNFALDANPLTGVVGSYSLGSATTNASGQATMSALSTTGWLEGVYTITVQFVGTTNCAGSSNQATLMVASPGNSATGGGWYTLSGSGRINLGFNVRKVDKACTVNCSYKGNLLLINNGKWRMKGNLTLYSKLATGQGQPAVLETYTGGIQA